MKLAMTLNLLLTAFVALAGAQGAASWSSGIGPVTPSIAATWAGRRAPGVTDSFAPATLDLLVLWRGAHGWHEKSAGQSVESGAGPRIDATHAVWVGSRKLELRVDSTTNTAYLEGQALSLEGVNVVMVDNVTSNVHVAGTAWIDPSFTLSADLVSTLAKRSPAVAEFVASPGSPGR
jgi:hypothetical protein